VSPAAAATRIKVADEVWIVTALLHREQPWRAGFRASEILDRAVRENLNGAYRPGVQVHIALHCVANRPPNPGRYRMLYSLPGGERRLFRPGDDYHPAREGGKMRPQKADIPREFHALVDWYDREYNGPDEPGQSLRGALKPRPSGPAPSWEDLDDAIQRGAADDFTG
jgi:hypothetical protein